MLGEHYCSDRFNFDLLRFELFDAPTLPADADSRGRHASSFRVESGEQSASFVLLSVCSLSVRRKPAPYSRDQIHLPACESETPNALDDLRCSSDFVASGPRSAFRWSLNQPALGCRVGRPGH